MAQTELGKAIRKELDSWGVDLDHDECDAVGNVVRARVLDAIRALNPEDMAEGTEGFFLNTKAAPHAAEKVIANILAALGAGE